MMGKKAARPGKTMMNQPARHKATDPKTLRSVTASTAGMARIKLEQELKRQVPNAFMSKKK